ncbi:MAG: hypothetical protein IT432_07120 [Phycisphaerales bacterium]|nr:hypothetical protein [Phycisphaerales bacterium]
MSSNSKRLAWRGMDEKSAQVSEGIDMWKHEIIPIELQRRRNASRWWLAGGAVLIALAWAVGVIVCAAVGSTSSRMGASGQIEELPPFIAGMLSGIVASFVVREVLQRRVDASSLENVDPAVLAANGAALVLAALVEFVKLFMTAGGA